MTTTATLRTALATCEANAAHFDATGQPAAAEYQRTQAEAIRARLNAAAPTIQAFLYEIYLSGPQGQTGWEIQTGWIAAMDRADAMAYLRALPRFDQDIDCYEAGMNAGDTFTHTTPRAAARQAARLNLLRTVEGDAADARKEAVANGHYSEAETMRTVGAILAAVIGDGASAGHDTASNLVDRLTRIILDDRRFAAAHAKG